MPEFVELAAAAEPDVAAAVVRPRTEVGVVALVADGVDDMVDGRDEVDVRLEEVVDELELVVCEVDVVDGANSEARLCTAERKPDRSCVCVDCAGACTAIDSKKAATATGLVLITTNSQWIEMREQVKVTGQKSKYMESKDMEDARCAGLIDVDLARFIISSSNYV